MFDINQSIIIAGKCLAITIYRSSEQLEWDIHRASKMSNVVCELMRFMFGLATKKSNC